MTQDEIIGMAKQAWISNKEAQLITEFKEAYISCTYLTDLEAFAKLVAEKEREACAAICDELHKARVGKDNYFAFAANAIRELRAKQ
jgi:hypothetical protein